MELAVTCCCAACWGRGEGTGQAALPPPPKLLALHWISLVSKEALQGMACNARQGCLRGAQGQLALAPRAEDQQGTSTLSFFGSLHSCAASLPAKVQRLLPSGQIVGPPVLAGSEECLKLGLQVRLFQKGLCFCAQDKQVLEAK